MLKGLSRRRLLHCDIIVTLYDSWLCLYESVLDLLLFESSAWKEVLSVTAMFIQPTLGEGKVEHDIELRQMDHYEEIVSCH